MLKLIKNFCIIQSIIQSGALLFRAGNHDSSHILSFVTFSGYIIHHIFPLLRFSSNIPDVRKCSSFFLLNTWPKKFVWCEHILFMTHLAMSVSGNTVLFDFFAVSEIGSILCRNHISVASSFDRSCFEIVQASHPYIIMGSIQLSRALLV